MEGLFAALLTFLVASPCLCVRIIADDQILLFNVVNYGAKGDGQSDDSQAILKVWQEVCGATHQGTPILLIPKGRTFLLQPTVFNGPCKSASINVQVKGNLVAPKSVTWKWPDNKKDTWIKFSDMNGLVINGGGAIDGRGAAWWKCCSNRPTALHFHNCNNLQHSDLIHINSPRNHISVDSCNGAQISNLHIFAPEDSPNTDGIDISTSSNIFIRKLEIKTGDDCIAINSGSSFINITDVACGPGHGISVGSLGENGQYATVEEIHVHNCSFIGTQNGVRIKTWQGGSGYARKITFEDIHLVAANNPLIIDQYYDPNDAVRRSAVKVSDVTYRQIHGTSSVEDAIQLNCDNSIGCTNLMLYDINITSSASGKKTYASCNNAHGTFSLSTPNIPCLHD